MATSTNYVKIGLFVVLGFAAAAALAIAVGVISTSRKKTMAYYTFFNEPVTGLDVGGVVKARGVDVGHVGEITFAPDRRMIQVRMDLTLGVLDRFGGSQANHQAHPDLRAQLVSPGLTGSRFVSIDFFDPTTNPPPTLGFAPPEHYIPAAKSSIKSIEDSVTKAMDGLASLVDELSREGLSQKAVQAVSNVNDVLTEFERFLASIDRQQIPTRTAATIEQLQVAVAKINKVIDRVDGDAGLVATAQRSVGSIAEVGRNASGAARDLDQTLAEIRDAAAAIRLLADQLEREPDSLLKGRARVSSP